MKIRFLFMPSIALFALVTGCTKEIETTPQAAEKQVAVSPKSTVGVYTTFTILKGAHYADNSPYKTVKTAEMKFKVRFDSSAIYTTKDPLNQSDINKLYGFSEGLNNQYNSARFGWSWFNNRLNIFAYVYNRGVRSHKRIASVAIGAEHTCSIRVSGSSYIFTINGISTTMTRGLKTTTASGLQQYPYFGGDETAPHTIKIMIMPL